MRSPAIKIGLVVVGAIASLALLRFKPWNRAEAGGVQVGFLPVT